MFQTGDEVSIVGGWHTTPVVHLTVTKAGKNKVTLSDGSSWKHDGTQWGQTRSWSRFDRRLVSRERGIQHESFNKAKTAQRAFENEFSSLLRQLSKTGVVRDAVYKAIYNPKE